MFAFQIRCMICIANIMYSIFIKKLICKCKVWVTLVFQTIKKYTKSCLFVLPICPVLQGYPEYASDTNCQVA